MAPRRHVVLFITVLAMLCSVGAREDTAIYGTWLLDEDESTDVVVRRGRTPRLEIRNLGDAVTIVHGWQNRRRVARTDSLTIIPGGAPVAEVVEFAVWPQNRNMGVLAKVGSVKTTKATWLTKDRRFVAEIEQVVEVSQGEATVVTIYEYALEPGGDRLILTERRSTRPTPIRLVFDRVPAGTGEGAVD